MWYIVYIFVKLFVNKSIVIMKMSGIWNIFWDVGLLFVEFFNVKYVLNKEVNNIVLFLRNN